jgi:hypothetical protein
MSDQRKRKLFIRIKSFRTGNIIAKREFYLLLNINLYNFFDGSLVELKINLLKADKKIKNDV